MSAVRFFPIRWFEDFSWKSVQVIGQLENNQSVFIRVAFRPYFTIKYSSNITSDEIDEAHAYLMSETPVDEVSPMKDTIGFYRVYILNKDDYFDSINFYKSNGLGTILDEFQDIKSKFFAEKRINPGSWQQATDLRTLLYNVTTNTSYTSYELEFYTKNISSIDYNVPIPKCKIAFFDIEAIPSDNVSFPDEEAEGHVDNIFAFSLVDVTPTQVRNIIYILTDQLLPEKYTTDPLRTGQAYQVEIIRASSEKELIQRFFEGLAQIRPNRLVSMNGRRFDINYIGARARALGIQLPSFTPILEYKPYFYPTTIVQTKPFPLVDEVWALSTPSISQIDILDFYRRLLPQLGNHKLETLGKLILGRGKTGLGIQEMFAKYRHGTPSDLLEIIDYSIIDSILLYDLWNASNVDQQLALMASEWRNDAEYVLTHNPEILFEDLIRYIQPDIPTKQYNPGKPISTERKQGIHRNIYLYSFSIVYATFLEQLQDPLSTVIANYFRNTIDAIIPFKSGYFPVTFAQVQDFILSQVNSDQVIWIEENSLAVAENPISPSDKQGPITFLPILDFIPLIIVSQKSWILVNRSGVIFKKGMSSFVRPPFRLIERYVNYLISFLINKPGQPVHFPNFDTSLEDFILETKVTAEDFATMPSRKADIIQQLRELNTPITTTWRKVRYIKTKAGNIIEEIYSKNPDIYISEIDLKYYNSSLQKTLKSINYT
jgi:hypothetical protein